MFDLYSFEIRQRDGLARIGLFSTPHGVVETPTLMPVINPNNIIISPKEMKEMFGTSMIITNSYIINKTAHVRERAMEDGLHSVIDFQGPIMTDSGAFQEYVYGKVNTTPEDIITFQRDIGSDIGTILDIFSRPDMTREETVAAVEETLERAKNAEDYAGNMGIAFPVQGGVYPDLRERCAKEICRFPAAIHPIGGVVPLMEDYRYKELASIIVHSKKGLRHDRPVHLFGCGQPMLFPMAILLGCDFFDSASYIKYARNGRMMFPWGTRHLKEMTELPCSCPMCSQETVEGLLAMDHNERTRNLAIHNLSVSFGEIRRIKQAIRDGRLWEMALHRARAHPRLLEALWVLKQHSPWIEKFTHSTRKRGMLFTGVETLWRPEIYHALDRLIDMELYQRDNYVLFPFSGGDSLELARSKNQELEDLWQENGILVETLFGPVPIELIQAYPFGSFVAPVFPKDWEPVFYPVVEDRTKRVVSLLLDSGKEVEELDVDILEEIRINNTDENQPAIQKTQTTPFEISRLKMVCDYQFFSGAGNIIMDGDVSVHRSKRTGKIRNVVVDGEHVLSLRAEDGMFTLRLTGAKRLCHHGKGKHVVVDSETGEYNKQGKNVMSKFVLNVSSDMNPSDEVYVVDEDNNLLAVGRALLNAAEIEDFQRGIAIKVREGADHQSPDDEEDE